MWPCAHGDCSAPCATTIRGRLSCHHLSPDLWLASFTPPTCRVGSLPPCVPIAIGSRVATCSRTHDRLPYCCVSRTQGRLPSLHPLTGWALLSSRVTRPVTNFLIYVPLWGELSCHNVSPDPSLRLLAG
jgi:hypothetical protein